jgi:hypothetical protein
MEQIKSRGGNRQNAGRKPSGIRKSQVTCYVDNAIIERHGKEQLRNKIYNYLKTIKDDTGTTI